MKVKTGSTLLVILIAMMLNGCGSQNEELLQKQVIELTNAVNDLRIAADKQAFWELVNIRNALKNGSEDVDSMGYRIIALESSMIDNGGFDQCRTELETILQIIDTKDSLKRLGYIIATNVWFFKNNDELRKKYE